MRGPQSTGASAKGGAARVGGSSGNQRVLQHRLGRSGNAVDIRSQAHGYIGITSRKQNDDLSAMKLAVGKRKGRSHGVADLGPVPVQGNVIVIRFLRGRCVSIDVESDSKRAGEVGL